MKALLIPIFLASFFPNFSYAAQSNEYPNAISVADAKAKLDAGTAILIDVRESDEVALGMAAPALWYAKSSIDKDLGSFIAFLTHEANGKEIIIYCRSGHRASLVIQALSEQHIFAFNMGGFQDWVDAGFPTKNP